MPEISGVWLYVLGIATGVIPTGIAFLTYVLRRRTQKTKLAINVMCFRELSDGALTRLALEVRIVNHCHFDVTISKIGLRVRKNWYSRQRFSLRPNNPFSRDDSFPYRLGARDETTFRIPIRKQWFVDSHDTVFEATDVFVETATKHRFYGRGVGLKTFIKEARGADLPKLRDWGE